ncbi:MAG TPA: ribosome biogenesis GTPase Der [Vicinamibacteria bacterium]|nr:ribosome biogenesis GTPase Der [Vicinamibacteria bacterium]
MVTLPRIALVGRPNVGKSTLFNRIAGRRKAIIDARPGSTRDRNYAQTSWQGAAFELIDTGGLLLETHDPLLGPASEQAERAIAEADLVLLVVDGRAGLLPDDAAIAARLRRSGKRVVVAVNKVEGNAEAVVPDFARLGFDTVVPLSAEHGLGVGDLLDEALSGLPRVEAAEETEAPLKLAIVGRPNVGKSSLLNRLIGEERAVVSPVPGTTRDAVDSLLEKDGTRYLFVDTAGIRRQRHLKENVDHVSVVQARRALDRAQVALLVLDATEGLREMDATIGGYAAEAGRATVIAVNKWDVADTLGLKQRAMREAIRDHLKFLSWAPIVFVSARSGRGLTALLKAARKAAEAGRTRITTGQLNRLLSDAAQRFPPKAMKGNQPVKILFGTQIGVSPPTFALSLNHPVDLHFSYRRYLENQLRAALDLEGTPVVIKVRTRPH